MIRRLLALPDQLWAQAERRPFSFRALADYQAALAIGILTFAPLRIANLASLEFGRTLRLPSRDGLCALIDIPGEEMKAGRAPHDRATPCPDQEVARLRGSGP